MIKNTHKWHYISHTGIFDLKFTNQKSIKLPDLVTQSIITALEKMRQEDCE